MNARRVLAGFVMVAAGCGARAVTPAGDGGGGPDVAPGDPCGRYVGCLSCTSQSMCGWCAPLHACLEGTASGPLGSDGCPGSWAWTMSQCGGGTDASMACAIDGRYVTDGVSMELILSPDGRYATGDGAFQGTYTWDGSLLTFTPGPGGTSSDCPSRFGSSVRLAPTPGCAGWSITVVTDGCTGSGLLTTAHTLTRE